MRKRKNSLFVLAAVAVTSLSSCNRGVGCPSNFSIETETLEAITTAITSFVTILF